MSQLYKMDVSRRAKQFAPFAALSGFETHLENAEKSEYEIPKCQTKINVIISFNIDGKMLPLWYSFSGMKFKIENVIWSVDKPNWIQYRCAIYDNNLKKIVDLFFYKESNVWTLA